MSSRALCEYILSNLLLPILTSLCRRSEFEECVENSQNPLCAGKLLVHLASERITAIPRKQVPKCCVQFEYRLGKLLLAYSESVTFDKTADQFLHAVLRTRLDVHRLAMYEYYPQGHHS